MMMLYPTFYGETCNPADQLECMRQLDLHLYFSDVQVRGAYSSKAKAYWKRQGLTLDITPEDEAALQDGTVDYIGFSYYNSNVATAGSRADRRQHVERGEESLPEGQRLGLAN